MFYDIKLLKTTKLDKEPSFCIRKEAKIKPTSQIIELLEFKIFLH